MNNAFLRRAGVACLAFVAVAALLLTLPTARLKASSSGVLEACLNPGNGMMRLVDSSTACHANEAFVEWNITGPQGPQGPAGPQGPPGASSGGPPLPGSVHRGTTTSGTIATLLISISSMAARPPLTSLPTSWHLMAPTLRARRFRENLQAQTILGKQAAQLFPSRLRTR